MVVNFNKISFLVDFGNGEIASLNIGGKERLAYKSPLFRVCLRKSTAENIIVTAYDAASCIEIEDGAIYTDFSGVALSVRVCFANENGEAAWRIAVIPSSDVCFVEWVDFLPITLPKLVANNEEGNGGRILFPYNEGVLVSDIDTREVDNAWLKHEDAKYPSKGSYAVFPNMVCSQMLAYLWDDVGLYIGVHDEQRGVKEIDFIKVACGVTLRFRLFCGTDFGEVFETKYPMIFSVIDGRWDAAAERYRKWFESTLPKNVRRIAENRELPEWYEDSPLVVTYPVRGVHDTDEMNPNKLYPYTNALLRLDAIKEACDSRLLVLLMHWEGTAPWAPPYVWPPFGDNENFNEFLRLLHEKGDMLGVYCSGFGYTIQSKLITEYNKEDEYIENELWRGMCASPEGKALISNICNDQRSGYDICPASDIGKSLLKNAYTPLLESELDYVQILDQNHGGGQYFCYSRDHGHAPAPGAWMTENMQEMLSNWNSIAKNKLLGCESAAAEPFIGNLLFSDNRFELNYMLGTPVPLYAYIYHEYLRNFMGNQVCCPFKIEEDTLRYRLAYSFSIGDSMTLVMSEDGRLASHWGIKDFSFPSDDEKTFGFIAKLTRFYKEYGKPYLYAGRMITSPEIECSTVMIPKANSESFFSLPALLSSAWEARDGSRALIIVNPHDNDLECKVNGNKITVPSSDVIMIPLL